MTEAAKIGDIFVTVTGCKDIIRREHFEVMKSGAIFANAGHFDVEINKVDLNDLAVSVRTARRNIQEFAMADGRKLYLLAEGRLVNLAAGDGHPAEIMDLSFAMQTVAALHILEHHQELTNDVHQVSYEFDQKVAALKLKAMGFSVDKLTKEQEEYINQA